MDGRTEESLLKSASSIMRYKSMNRRARPERTKKLDLILSFFLEGKLKKKNHVKIQFQVISNSLLLNVSKIPLPGKTAFTFLNSQQGTVHALK